MEVDVNQVLVKWTGDFKLKQSRTENGRFFERREPYEFGRVGTFYQHPDVGHQY